RARAPHRGSAAGRRPGPTGARVPAGPGRERLRSLRLPGGSDDLDDDALLLVEELLRQRRPALEVLVDGEQLLGLRERVVRVPGALDAGGLDAVDDRPEALQRELALALLAQHEVEPWLRFGVGVLGDRSGVLDEDRGLRNNPVEFLAVLGREDRLVL